MEPSAFVITTHHDGYLCVKECILRVMHFSPESRIWLFVNEGEGKTLTLSEEFPSINVTFIADQKGGLTYTWNEGIRQCLLAGIKTIVILNDDALVNESISDLILAASNPLDLAIYGPGTSQGGAPLNPESWVYHMARPTEPLTVRWLKLWHGLNGFCLAFHARMVLSNMFDEVNFFNPSIPFGGNETEWGKRWFMKGGRCGVVDSCYVHHKKHRSWFKLTTSDRKIKVHPPGKGLVKNRIGFPPKHKVALISFSTASSEADLYALLPMVNPGNNFLICGGDSFKTTQRSINGWRIMKVNVKNWNMRLRWKHMLIVLRALQRKNLFEKAIVVDRPSAVCFDLSFFVNSVSGMQKGIGSIGPIAALPHIDFPTLQSHAESIEMVSDFMLHPFPMPKHSVPHFNTQLLLFQLNLQTLNFFSEVYDQGDLIDWNLDFCMSWLAHTKDLNIFPISQRWAKKISPEIK